MVHDASSLKSPKEKKDENNYQDRPDDTGRSIAPTPAVRPGGQGADEKKNEDDN
jgi:hypothetical protein